MEGQKQTVLNKLNIKIYDFLKFRYYERFFKKEDPWHYKEESFEESIERKNQFKFIEDRQYDFVLEVGCCEGVMTKKLLNYCNRIDAVDVSPTVIQRAKENYPDKEIHFMAANIRSYPLEKEKYDLITLVEVMHHLHKKRYSVSKSGLVEFVTNVLTSLKKDGNILISNGYNPKNESGASSRKICHSYRNIFTDLGMKLEGENEIQVNDTRKAVISFLKKAA